VTDRLTHGVPLRLHPNLLTVIGHASTPRQHVPPLRRRWRKTENPHFSPRRPP
jgi:hypothetical protein